jgi:hypothetical protein
MWREPVGQGGGADWGSRAATFLALLTLLSSPCTEVPSAPFLKYGTQKCASGASVVWEDDPTPMPSLSGLAAA